MRIWPRNRFVPGTYKRECDRCGWDYLESELSVEYETKLLVCKKCLDPKDPQLHIKARPEKPKKLNVRYFSPVVTAFELLSGLFGRDYFGSGIFGE